MPRVGRPGLEPERDVERHDGRFLATGSDPWLRLTGLDLDRFTGRLVEIVYRSSLFDEPVRPVLRFSHATGALDHVCAGPVAGAAIWTGRVPADADGISISPTDRPGPFDFAIESLRVCSWPALLADGLRRNPRSTRSAILTRLIGWRPESDNNLAWAIGATPVADFVAWEARRRRAPDPTGFERPRFDWRTAPRVLVVVRAEAADAEALARTCAGLAGQLFEAWHAVLVGAGRISGDPRIAAATSVEAALAGAADGTLAAVIAAGDVLVPTALATLVEQAHRHPRRRAFYGDAVLVGPTGRRPAFLPGWSPRLQAALPYLAAPVFVRDPHALDPAARQAMASLGARPAAFAPDEVMALRQVMVEREAPPQGPPAPPVPPPPAGTRASASVIVPTKDHPDLLRRAIAAIRARTAGEVEIVVVDNASTTPEAIAHLAELRAAPDVRVMDYPGAFNFSRICNEAAAVARGEILVFLNDDTEVLSDGWLDRLCAHAGDPGLGAIGARLTYPDGRLQHVGVLLGMGGSAGHFGAPAPGDDPGWAGRNRAVHEVSAITGACLAVARQKFEAVGGFDAEHLPIELSDIDLCLKLNARGWQTIVDPAVHIMHEESASRGGATLRRLAVHDRERAVFLQRWRHALRDDPFFHPGLSLYSWREALG